MSEPQEIPVRPLSEKEKKEADAQNERKRQIAYRKMYEARKLVYPPWTPQREREDLAATAEREKGPVLGFTPLRDEKGAQALEEWLNKNETNQKAREMVDLIVHMLFDEDRHLVELGRGRKERLARLYSDERNADASIVGRRDLASVADNLYAPKNSADPLRQDVLAPIASVALKTCRRMHALYMPSAEAPQLDVVADIVESAYRDAHWKGDAMMEQTRQEVKALLIDGTPTAVHAPSEVMGFLERSLRCFVKEDKIQSTLLSDKGLKPMSTQVLEPLAPCSTAMYRAQKGVARATSNPVEKARPIEQTRSRVEPNEPAPVGQMVRAPVEQTVRPPIIRNTPASDSSWRRMESIPIESVTRTDSTARRQIKVINRSVEANAPDSAIVKKTRVANPMATDTVRTKVKKENVIPLDLP